jgi:hypothetical protein
LRSNRARAVPHVVALAVGTFVLLAVGWTDGSFVRYITTRDALAPRSLSWLWGARFFVDLVAALFVASLGVLVAGFLGRIEGTADHARPSPGLLAVILLAGAVVLHLAKAGLEWWLAPPWMPRPPPLHLIWLRAGNNAAIAVMSSWSLLSVTGLRRFGRRGRVDQIGHWIGCCLVISALCWWAAWAFWS